MPGEWPYHCHPMETPEREFRGMLAIAAAIFAGGFLLGTLTSHYFRTDAPRIERTSPSASEMPADRTVYVTRSGARYHRATCPSAKTATPASLSEARARGLTPCQRCKP